MFKYRADLIASARTLRSNMTDAEQRLWMKLRRRQLCGVQFYRQRPIGNFIVDFFAPKSRLVVEVDGSQHLDASGAKRDKKRDELLADLGLKVLRFDNLQVLNETDAVLEAIRLAVVEALPDGKSPLSPLFQRGG